jgi:hypothetical protein
MSSPPPYDMDSMKEQVSRWIDAAEAFRRGDREDAVDLLTGPELSDLEWYPLVVAMATLGAVLVANEYARANGHALGQPGGAYAYDIVTRPGKEPPAYVRVAASMVAAAANGDFNRAGEQANTFAAPDDKGMQRLTLLLAELMFMYVDMADSA